MTSVADVPVQNPARENQAQKLPLVIDLEGALLKTSPRDEAVLARLRSLVGKLTGQSDGAESEQKIAAAANWPVHQEVADYASTQALAGRKVVLAATADASVTEAIAARFGFISEVIVAGRSDGDIALQTRFPDGFEYIRSISDLPSAALPANILKVTVHSLRLHQWTKNALVFVPLILGGSMDEMNAWYYASLGFIALGFAASGTYIINDLWDLPSDRRHWSKRHRPFANGDLSIRTGVVLALAAIAASFAIGAWIGGDENFMLALYVVGALSYSLIWKRVAVVDVFVLASLFTLRLGLGIVLVDARISPWLLVFSMFVFLSLSAAKRYTELLRLGVAGLDRTPGRGYVAADAPLVLGLGLAAMLGAVLILIVYILEDAFPRAVYSDTRWLWTIPPILFLFLGRIWLLSQRGQMLDDPVAFALKDRISLLYGVLMSLGFLAALFGLGFSFSFG